jgi:hypothetical protein
MHAIATGSIRTRLTEKTHKSLSQTSTHILSGNYDIPLFPTTEASNQRDMLHQYMHIYMRRLKKKMENPCMQPHAYVYVIRNENGTDIPYIVYPKGF